MHQLSFASLTWREAPMPGASPVQMALLPKLPDGGFRAFVRFPVGWSRPDVGHYAVPEEFLVLEGELSLNGETWNRGELAWIAAWTLRRELRSASGCLVFAWFGGTPRWIPGEPTAKADARRTHDARIQGREFVRVSDAARETLSLDNFGWRVTPP
jgi:hypothetical protein